MASITKTHKRTCKAGKVRRISNGKSRCMKKCRYGRNNKGTCRAKCATGKSRAATGRCTKNT